MHENTNFTDRLWQYVHGVSDAELTDHLEACPDCQDELRVLQGLSAMRERELERVPQAPESLNQTLYGLLNKVRPDLVPNPTESASPRKPLVKIIAELIQDTAAQPQIVGLRGDTRTRQISFTSDVADLDLEVSPQDEQFLIVGQLGMDEIPTDINIRFVPSDADPLDDLPSNSNVSNVSEQGYFQMEVAGGNWVIAVDVDDAVVLFPNVRL